MAHHMAAQPGSRIGAYEILGLLGAGGMGEVYRARDTRLQREVAIKIIPDALANDAVARGRFETEARAVASLSHPNIIAIHDFGQEGTVAYAVMELLDGRSLREMLADGPLPPRKAIDYGAQIAAGLAAAHARGVVHRDLKPENVFITRDGRQDSRLRAGKTGGSDRRRGNHRGDLHTDITWYRPGDCRVYVAGAGARRIG
jgi:eukaryotic-like serine/threonine-protein kinase